MTEMFRDVVRGFSLVHDPEGSHYKRGAFNDTFLSLRAKRGNPGGDASMKEGGGH
jgi:hypothetical protein